MKKKKQKKNYRAETEALKQAAILVKDSLEPCSPTVFLTDALSVLEALQTNKSPLLATQMQEVMQSSSPMDPWQRASRSASQMRSTRRATINKHPLPGKDHHHQNSAETQTGEGCIPGPEEDHQLHHCCWTGRVGEREEEEDYNFG